MKQEIQANDVVFCADSGKLFEAKILKVQNINDIKKYFIHYNGWARKFDTWVDDCDISPKDDPKRVKQLQEYALEKWIPGAKREAKAAKAATANSKVNLKKSVSKNQKVFIDNRPESSTSEITQETEPESESGKTTRKRKAADTKKKADNIDTKKIRRGLLLEDLVDEEEDLATAKLPLPFNLKKYLVHEWNVITKDMRRLVLLPKQTNYTVATLLNNFLEAKKAKLDAEDPALIDYKVLCAGLRIQFDKALPSILLYRQEREQYNKLKSIYENKDPSELYGHEHLARFFVRMPKLISSMVLPQNDLNKIFSLLVDLLKFISKFHDENLKSNQLVPAVDALESISA